MTLLALTFGTSAAAIAVAAAIVGAAIYQLAKHAVERWAS